MNKEQWTVEWSEGQQCFHVDFLENTIKNGLQDFSHGIYKGDWKFLGLFDTHREAHELVDKLRAMRNIPTLSEKFGKECL